MQCTALGSQYTLAASASTLAAANQTALTYAFFADTMSLFQARPCIESYKGRMRCLGEALPSPPACGAPRPPRPGPAPHHLRQHIPRRRLPPPPRPPHLCLPAACSQQYDRATGSNESDPAYQGALTNYVQNWGTHYVWRAWAGRMRSQAMLMST